MRRLSLLELVGLRREQPRLTVEQQEEKTAVEDNTGGFIRYAGSELSSVHYRNLRPHTPNLYEIFHYSTRRLMTRW